MESSAKSSASCEATSERTPAPDERDRAAGKKLCDNLQRFVGRSHRGGYYLSYDAVSLLANAIAAARAEGVAEERKAVVDYLQSGADEFLRLVGHPNVEGMENTQAALMRWRDTYKTLEHEIHQGLHRAALDAAKAEGEGGER